MNRANTEYLFEGIEIVEITEDELISLYKEKGSIWKVGDKLGLKGQIVHKWLTEIGAINKMNYFTDVDCQVLKSEYSKHRDIGMLSVLANRLGRTVPFITRKAKELGLTIHGLHISMKPFSEDISKRQKEWHSKNEHPRGMLGKKHSQEAILKFSKATKARWMDPNSSFNSNEHRQERSNRMSKLQASGKLNNNYSRTKSGRILIADKEIFVRSSWEANIAAYFQFQKESNLIKDWNYEPDVFWFKEIMRGVRSYKPDFKITNTDGSTHYVEVKGWMDSKSITKLNRMKKYYPDVKIDLIDKKRYSVIAKKSGLFKYWGALDRDELKVQYVECSIDGCKNKRFNNKLCRKHYTKVYGIKSKN